MIKDGSCDSNSGRMATKHLWNAVNFCSALKTSSIKYFKMSMTSSQGQYEKVFTIKKLESDLLKIS